MNIPDQDSDYNIIGILVKSKIIIYEANNCKTLGFYDKRERRRLKKILLPEVITCFSISENEKIIGYVDEANQGWAIYTSDWQRAIIALKNEQIFAVKMISQRKCMRVISDPSYEYYSI